MNVWSKYKITIEDESRLENVFQASTTLFRWISAVALAVAFLLAVGALMIVFSPAHYLLPGYLKDSERAATEEQHMRVDSLQTAFNTNAAFISNIMNIINGDISELRESAAVSEVTSPLSPDSLIPTSSEEMKFSSMMREREKYNISVIAPLAAESMMFSTINDDAVFSDDSKKSHKAKVIIPKGATVSAIADGTVVSVSQSIREGGGTAVIIQHPKGFLSRCSRLGTVLIEPGDIVTSGQIIAIPSRNSARKAEIVYLELWHNGDRLIPFDYLDYTLSKEPPAPIIDEEVGRGRL